MARAMKVTEVLGSATTMLKSAALIFWVILLSGFTHPDEMETIETEGMIQSLNLAQNTLIISGLRYRVALDAEVEIGGSFGAYSMLQEGMKVMFVYRRIDHANREIIRVIQLSDSYRLAGY